MLLKIKTAKTTIRAEKTNDARLIAPFTLGQP